MQKNVIKFEFSHFYYIKNCYVMLKIVMLCVSCFYIYSNFCQKLLGDEFLKLRKMAVFKKLIIRFENMRSNKIFK